ncbi:MAG: hypothetical protein AAFV53_34565 [Myxococcota bacterium]
MKTWVRVGLIGSMLVPGIALIPLAWNVHQEETRWPALAEMSIVSTAPAPAPGNGDGWVAIQRSLAAINSANGAYQAHLSPVGSPETSALTAWTAQEPAIAILRDMLNETTGLTVPMPVQFDQPLTDLTPLEELSAAWLLKGWSDAALGRNDAAIQEMGAVWSLGVRLTQGDGPLEASLVGYAIQEMALQEMGELLETPTGRSRRSLQFAAAALADQPQRGAIARGMVTVCRQTEQLLDNVLTSPVLISRRYGVSTRILMDGLYDTEQTMVWNRQRCHDVVRFAAADPVNRKPLTMSTFWKERSLVHWIHNPAGRQMMAATRPDVEPLVQREDQLIAAAHVRAAWVATQQYQLSHHGAPDALQMLSANGLGDSLTDPYSGQMLRYDGRAIWSVGADQETDQSAPLRLTL